MPFMLGMVMVAAVIYFACMSRPGDTRWDALKKIAQIVVVLLVVLLVAFIFFITGHRGG